MSRAMIEHPHYHPGWSRLLVAASARSILGVLAGLLLWAVAPAALGWQPTTVMTGSMAPRIAVGDIVVARPVGGGTLHPGQVLLVTDPDHPGRLRLHRLDHRIDNGELVLRGDANPAADSTPVTPAAVHGVGALRVPWIGIVVVWATTGQWPALALLAAALLALAALAAIDGAPRAAAATTSPRPSRRRTALLRHHRIVTAAGAVLAALATVAVLVQSHAGSAYAATTTNTGNTLAAIPYYTCRAAVLADSPYLYYRLNEASATNGSTAADTSGNSHAGTYLGSGTLAGQAGSCARDASTAVTLNGSTGYLSTPALVTNPTVFTVEIWFKTTTSAGGRLVGFGNSQTGASSQDDRHLYLTNTGKIVFGVQPGGPKKTITSTASYNDGTWHLADATLSAAGTQLYLDGQQVATDPATTTAQIYSGYWRIGYDTLASWPNAPTSYFLAATIDDAAIYPTALTATQIANHNTAGR